MSVVPQLTRKSKNDECYTPAVGVLPIIQYLNKEDIIWCPFDTIESEFVIQLKANGFKVEYSHIDTGQDFFTYEPEQWDVLVSNPPFSNKKSYFERALSFGKPFALLMTNTWLNDAAPKRIFKDTEIQLLMFEERLEYQNPKGNTGRVPFSSSYYCQSVLPQQIVFDSFKHYGHSS